MARKKRDEAAMPVKMKPQMYLEGKEAQGMAGVKPGQKVRMVVEGTLREHGAGLPYDGRGGLRHHATVEVHSVKPHAPAKPKPAKAYEGSKADMKADKAAAKKAGVSMKAYENSAADKRADKAGAKKMAPKKGGR